MFSWKAPEEAFFHLGAARREKRAGDSWPPLLIARQESSDQKFSVRLSTASAASFMASDKVGCAWQIRAMSSAAPRNSMLVTASAISSAALRPLLSTPRTYSVLASATHLTKPLMT